MAPFFALLQLEPAILFLVIFLGMDARRLTWQKILPGYVKTALDIKNVQMEPSVTAFQCNAQARNKLADVAALRSPTAEAKSTERQVVQKVFGWPHNNLSAMAWMRAKELGFLSQMAHCRPQPWQHGTDAEDGVSRTSMWCFALWIVLGTAMTSPLMVTNPGMLRNSGNNLPCVTCCVLRWRLR